MNKSNIELVLVNQILMILLRHCNDDYFLSMRLNLILHSLTNNYIGTFEMSHAHVTGHK